MYRGLGIVAPLGAPPGATWLCEKAGYAPAYEVPGINDGLHIVLASQGWTCQQIDATPSNVVPPAPVVPGSPAPENVLYYNAQGEPYQDEFQSFWRTAGGDWYVGDKTGAILKIDYPPWLPPTVSPVTTPGSLPQPPGFLEVHSFELIAAGVGYAVAGVTGAILGFVGGTLFKGSQLQI